MGWLFLLALVVLLGCMMLDRRAMRREYRAARQRDRSGPTRTHGIDVRRDGYEAEQREWRL